MSRRVEKYKSAGPAASVWLGARADPKVVQRVLGHATASMTMDLYGNSRELHQTGAFALVAW